MIKSDLFKLNEIVSGLEKVIQRNKYYTDKYLQDNKKLLEQDPEFVRQVNMILNNPEQTKINNPLTELIKSYNVKNKIVFKYKLEKFLEYKEKHPEAINSFLSNKTIEQMSDCGNEFRWITQWLIINIDIYMDLFFKLLLNCKKIPKGFNDKPKENIYQKFPVLTDMLDSEFDSYIEMHSIRNNIAHNGMIVDNELNRTGIINIENDENDVSMYIVFPKQIFEYTISCLRIIRLTNDMILKIDHISKELNKKNILDLYKYYNVKN